MAESFSRTMNIYVESGEAQRAYQQLSAQQTTLNQKIQDYLDKGKQVPEKLSKQFEAVTKQMDIQSKKISGDLSPSMKDLSSTASKLNSELSRMSKEDAGFSEKVKQANEAKAAMEDYKKSVTSTGNSLRKMMDDAKGVALGVVVAQFAQQALQFVGNAVGSIFSFNNELDKSVKNLSAITGATGNDLEYLKQKAIDLGSTGSRSATEYVEAMKLIGSAKPELLANKEGLVAVTEAAKLLANASGLELPDAAKRLTDALNQYGAPAEEATKYVDALAAAAKYGAAEVPQVTDALLEFGTQAKSSNISIYESAGAIELMAEKGIKGAEAGTQLRNVFLRMSAVNSLSKEALDSLKVAGVDTRILTDNTLSLEKRLKEFSKISNDTTALVNVFGKENFNAGQIVLQNIPRYAELAKQIHEQGVANAQASTNTANLTTNWEKLKNVLVTLFSGMDLSFISRLVGGMADAARSFGEFMGIIKSTSQLMEQERQGLLASEIQITSLNIGNEKRVALIDALKEKYPQYLAGLDSEKATNEEIHKMLSLVNDEYLLKIALQEKQEELQKKLKSSGEALSKYSAAEASVQKAYAADLDYLKSYNPLLAEKIKQQTDGISLEEQLRRLSEGQIKLSAGERDALGVSIGLYNKLKDAKRNYLAGKFDADALQKEFANLEKTTKDLLAGLRAKSNVLGDVVITASRTQKTSGAPADKSAQNKIENDLEAFRKYYQKLKDIEAEYTAVLISDDEKEKARVQIKYNELKRQLDKFLSDQTISHSKFNDTLRLLRSDLEKEMKALDDKQYKDRSEKEYAATLIVTQNYYDRRKNIAKQQLSDQVINEQEYAVAIELIDSQLLHAKVQIAEDYKDSVTKAATDIVNFNEAAANRDIQNALNAANRKKSAMKMAGNLAIDTARIEGDTSSETNIRLRLMEQEYLEQMRINSLVVDGKEQNEILLTEITRNYTAKRIDISKQETIGKIGSYIGYAKEVVGIFENIGQIFTNVENAEIAADKRKNTKLVKQYDTALKEKRITQKLHDILVEQANESMAKKEDELRKKQFERNKAFQIVNAGMAAAGSVVQALNSPWPASIAFAALAGATGLTQIGIIASSEYTPAYKDGTPSFGEGSRKLGGEKHSGPNGGNWIINPDTGEVLATIEAEEAIIPADATKNNPEIVDSLLTKGRKRNLLDSMRPVQAMNFDKNLNNIQFANGGVWGLNNSTEPNSPRGRGASSPEVFSMYETNKLLMEQNKHLQAIAKKDLSVSVKEIAKKSDEYKNIITKD